ncbi:hypothetical protein N8I77_005276 [Diaporthe amygdali]|uniref:Uncharacterized protein n=1 Tax=Phomopsis amygdali TaxID=1214568 RepID=A0AAD9W383_PHOAM|nr:hypothetical protein N8I77_005276 [Diaporthe amygdali]
MTIIHILWASPTGRASKCQSQIADTYSPANDAIEYEYRQIFNDSRFLGPPRPEWDDLMESIMSGTLIRISEDELMMHGSDSIPLKDGGYAAGLGVAHSLHCVRLIKRFIYREQSYPDLSLFSDAFLHTQIHADHCLDYLRQSVMCQVDYSLYTLYWEASQQEIPAHHAPGPQKCVNWDSLHAWMRGRSTSTDMLMGPDI